MAERILLLVRHGQLDRSAPETGLGPGLTALGKRQASATGRFLSGAPIQRFISSPLTRAIETAQLVVSHVPGAHVQQNPLLSEVIPTRVPGMAIRGMKSQRIAADEAFAQFFVPPTRAGQFDCLVCHGNLIRYLVCRALGAPATAWLRLDVSRHCAISECRIDHTGKIWVCSYNDAGHLPPELRSVT